MSKRLKTLLIVLVGIVITAGLGVGGYFLIKNLSTTTVYNLRILNQDGVQVNDTSRFLLSNAENNFYIDIDMETSSGEKDCIFTTSDASVAKVVKKGGDYFVEYYKAGSATITAYSVYVTEIYDTFTIDVYDNFVADIIIDEKPNNELTVYGDGTDYTYNYKATGILADQNCNNMLTRVVENYDKDYIRSISINQADQTINIDTERVTEDCNQLFYLQTYYIDTYGHDHVVKNYAYYLNVIGYRIDDMQLLVSQDYNFEGNTYVCLSEGTNSDQAFLLDNEEVVSDIILTESVKNIYFKIRVIYSNKTYQDISYKDGVLPSEEKNEGNSTTYLNFIGGWPNNMDYWYVEFNKQSVALSETELADITRAFSVSYTDETVKSSVKKYFNITYKYQLSTSYNTFVNKDLYARVVDSNGNVVRYEYIYWDTRFRRIDTITDANGNITGFINGAPDCDTTKDIIVSE